MFQQFRVLLRPGEVRVTRRSGLPGGRGGRGGFERVFVVPGARTGGEEPWRASVQRVAEALTEMGAGGGTLRAVISDHFARYVLVPWSAELVSDAERIALARLGFGEVFGNAADGWIITMDEQPAGRASFGCAIDRALLQSLQDLAKALRLRLASVAPNLADRINRHRRALSDPTLCVASVEPGRLTMAFGHEGGWAAVRGRRIDGQALDGLAAALLQEAAASGVPSGGTLYLLGEDVGALPAFTVPGWKVVRLNDGASARVPNPALVAAQSS